MWTLTTLPCTAPLGVETNVREIRAQAGLVPRIVALTGARDPEVATEATSALMNLCALGTSARDRAGLPSSELIDGGGGGGGGSRGAERHQAELLGPSALGELVRRLRSVCKPLVAATMGLVQNLAASGTAFREPFVWGNDGSGVDLMYDMRMDAWWFRSERG